jgi:hypothetical protein
MRIDPNWYQLFLIKTIFEDDKMRIEFMKRFPKDDKVEMEIDTLLQKVKNALDEYE